MTLNSHYLFKTVTLYSALNHHHLTDCWKLFRWCGNRQQSLYTNVLYVFKLLQPTSTPIFRKATVLPAFAQFINPLLVPGIFPSTFKQARLTSLLKNTLNSPLVEDYGPESSCFWQKHLNSFSFSEQPPGWQTTGTQNWSFCGDCPALSCCNPSGDENCSSITCLHSTGPVCHLCSVNMTPSILSALNITGTAPAGLRPTSLVDPSEVT